MINIIDVYKNLFGRRGIADGSVIDMAEHGRAGGVNSGQGFKYISDIPELLLIDEVDANTLYVGKASIGASTGDSVWQIRKVSISGTLTTSAFAGGTDNYDQEWDNRVSLTYS